MKSVDSIALAVVAFCLAASCANDDQGDGGEEPVTDDDGGVLVDSGYGDVVTGTSDGGGAHDSGTGGHGDAGAKDSGSGTDAYVPPRDSGGSDTGSTCSGAGQLYCAGTCVFADGDPNNCGACGHSCQGQACDQGACAPITLSTAFVAVGGIAQDATNVYFVGADGTLKSVPKAGGATSTITTDLAGPIGVAVDATSAYVTCQGSGLVVKVALAGGAKTTLATNQPGPMAIVTNGTNVYWTTYGSGAANGTVMMCAATGCNNTPTLVAGQIQLPPANQYGPHTGLALDGASIYWSHFGGGGEVRKAPLAGGANQTLMSQIGFAYGLSLTNTTLAVAVFGGSGQILTGPVTGGSKLLVGNQAFPISSAVSEEAVYWTFYNPQSSGGAQVMKCPLSGCANKAQVLSRSSIQPSEGIVVDGSNVYWLSNDGNVYKTPR
jgi:hypothetical protein